ncbi:MAG: hypothetical protein ACLUOI_31580 [Eisenbergiella sp.]
MDWIEKPQFLKGVIGTYTTSFILAMAVAASAAASGADVISQGFDGLCIVTADLFDWNDYPALGAV